MKQIGSARIESFKEGGYKYIQYLCNGVHLLENTVTGHTEKWVSRSTPISGYNLSFKRTYLEFSSSSAVSIYQK